jgi:hypothetical protein
METWEQYEDAARDAIRKIANDIGLDRVVDQKKGYDGESTWWELDVTGYAKGTGQLVVFECRRRSRNVEKGEMASFAYTVNDLKAKGFIVSQKQLGKGAKEIAQHEGIGHMQFKWDAETGDHVLRWLHNIYAAVSDKLETKHFISVEQVRDGKSLGTYEGQ